MKISKFLDEPASLRSVYRTKTLREALPSNNCSSVKNIRLRRTEYHSIGAEEEDNMPELCVRSAGSMMGFSNLQPLPYQSIENNCILEFGRLPGSFRAFCDGHRRESLP